MYNDILIKQQKICCCPSTLKAGASLDHNKRQIAFSLLCSRPSPKHGRMSKKFKWYRQIKYLTVSAGIPCLIEENNLFNYYFFTVKQNTLYILRKRMEIRIYPPYKWAGQETCKKKYFLRGKTISNSAELQALKFTGKNIYIYSWFSGLFLFCLPMMNLTVSVGDINICRWCSTEKLKVVCKQVQIQENYYQNQMLFYATHATVISRRSILKLASIDLLQRTIHCCFSCDSLVSVTSDNSVTFLIACCSLSPSSSVNCEVHVKFFRPTSAVCICVKGREERESEIELVPRQ